MTKKKLLNESILHYHRMIVWASEQPPLKHVCVEDMEKGIKETWLGYDCPLCAKYQKEALLLTGKCEDCPIFEITQRHLCENTPWMELSEAKTWGTWVKLAKKEKEFLEKVICLIE